MNKLRTLADVLRQAGFARITACFCLYLLCSTAVWLSEPRDLTFGDGLWFSFETVSTIGLAISRPKRRSPELSPSSERHQHFLHRHAHGRGGETATRSSRCAKRTPWRALWTILSIWKSFDRDELADLSRRVREYRRRQR